MIRLTGRPFSGLSILDRWEAVGRPFAQLPRLAAAVVLALTLAVLTWSITTTDQIDRFEQARAGPITNTAGQPYDRRGDLSLYERISARVAAGEGYYAAATDEQRSNGYPTRPFVTVRLPTLAYLHLLIGPAGVRYLEIAVLIGCLIALPGATKSMTTPPERFGAMVLLPVGGATVLTSFSGLYHEALAGVLLSFAVLIYRPHRWWPALLAAGLAIAVRELVVPFVMLWLVFALAGRRWSEAAGTGGLLAVFMCGMALHYLAVDTARLATDVGSEGWDAVNGYALPLMVVARLSVLSVFPTVLAAPLAILPLLGWFGLGGRLGLFASLWFGGLFTMIALFARPENFYWVQLVFPAYAIGLAFAPRALSELVRGVLGGIARQT
jgi:hypothetical protein